MATFVLIHGGGDSGWSWHIVADELRTLGHDVVTPDLPIEDESAGWTEYADAVVDAIGERSNLVVVGHSFGGFTAPLIAARIPVELLILVAAMIPLPGETPDDWWANSGYPENHAEDVFYHDVPAELTEEAKEHAREQQPIAQPWPLSGWPDVPTKFLLAKDDRLFPADFLRSLALERLGVRADDIAGGHYLALSRPRALAEALDGYLRPR